MNPSNEKPAFEIGIYTLGDIVRDPHTGKTLSAGQRLKEIIDAAKLADRLGLDVFGVGEHHRLDYAVSAPPVVLAAVAQATEQIRLTSTTTVLSTVDPVRLFEDFATLDLLSDGRAEVMAGRGAFIESFPLFGFDTADYDALFEENAELFSVLNENEVVDWSGSFRSPLRNAEIAPRPVQPEIPFWIGVGGTPESAVRAGRLGAGMALAILGGPLGRFKPFADLYRQAGAAAGHDPDSLRVGVTGHGFLAEDGETARDTFYPYYSGYWAEVNRQRGMAFRMSREDFDQVTGPDHALFVGSAEEVTEKILRQHELFGHTRFLAQLDIGGQLYEQVARSIELLATEVAPAVRKAVGSM
ncbi:MULTISPECIES: LLM class flavin-dependent oxidoreductase [Bhargavaea]|uniref:LLM class flavin-dependent oxidoreductase n=1 Tax=Bhargavaea changchunensis TaxID=2134037 RepID=A0ABW2NGX1_9BACL|nr:LLM class flavin-dependent oxidoreductase [Bhargavaea sp. CC-171006]